jgi:hypothetical protein
MRRGWYLDPDTDERIELLGPDGKRARGHRAFDPGKDSKVQRAHGMLPDWERGLMFFHDGASYLYPQVDDEPQDGRRGVHRRGVLVPRLARTDRVDALSQFIARHRTRSAARRRCP